MPGEADTVTEILGRTEEAETLSSQILPRWSWRLMPLRQGPELLLRALIPSGETFRIVPP